MDVQYVQSNLIRHFLGIFKESLSGGKMIRPLNDILLLVNLVSRLWRGRKIPGSYENILIRMFS